jgi:O-methyltransferase
VARSFEEVYNEVGGYTLIGGDRMRILWETAQHCAQFKGAMVEVGVYRGGSAALLRAAAPDHVLVLFDTFSGHPALQTQQEWETQKAGRFNDTTLEAVQSLVGDSAVFRVGIFPETLDRETCELLRTIAFVHCDVDLYESTRAVLERLWPQLVAGGALVCDDYGFGDCEGAQRAIEEFVVGRTDVQIERLPTLQARLWKVAV